MEKVRESAETSQPYDWTEGNALYFENGIGVREEVTLADVDTISGEDLKLRENVRAVEEAMYN